MPSIWLSVAVLLLIQAGGWTKARSRKELNSKEITVRVKGTSSLLPYFYLILSHQICLTCVYFYAGQWLSPKIVIFQPSLCLYRNRGFNKHSLVGDLPVLVSSASHPILSLLCSNLGKSYISFLIKVSRAAKTVLHTIP